MTVPYRKLVRDKIPAIIAQNGQIAKTRVLNDEAYAAALNAKLKEETREYLQSGSLTELADILEVVEALAKHQGSSFDDVLALKQKKQQTNGAFDRRIFLVSVEDAAALGKTVTVTVDRPLGSYHPEHKDLYYPVNYGYVEGIIAPDGEEQDAYVLGVDKPLTSFEGVVIAVIRRKNDAEDKWVVAPAGKTFTQEEIERAVRFQEQYFESEIIL